MLYLYLISVDTPNNQCVRMGALYGNESKRDLFNWKFWIFKHRVGQIWPLPQSCVCLSIYTNIQTQKRGTVGKHCHVLYMGTYADEKYSLKYLDMQSIEMLSLLVNTVPTPQLSDLYRGVKWSDVSKFIYFSYKLHSVRGKKRYLGNICYPHKYSIYTRWNKKKVMQVCYNNYPTIYATS